MLTKELQVEIDILHRQGKSIRAICRETGAARNTVRTILRGVNDVAYGPREARPTKLDDFKAYLQQRNESAGKIWLPATVLMREIQAQGYSGGITQLKEYLSTIRPAPSKEIPKRFETPPGKQLQIDFVVFRRGDHPLRAFTSELGYSRYAYVEFTNNERSDTLVSCLERAFQFFGSAPEHVLCDNPKTIVIKRNAYAEGEHQYNQLLLDFSKHYGVNVKLCAPYRAQTKGKVERFHRYLRESFFNPLQSLHANLITPEIANREVWEWLNDVANCRMHATLKERPSVRFIEEKAHLSALPAPYAGHSRERNQTHTIAVPTPIESLQHPLMTYDILAREVAA